MKLKSNLQPTSRAVVNGAIKYRYLITLLIVAPLLNTNNANASLVVDTGAGSPLGGGLSLTLTQWLAGQFTLTDSYRVTGVEGWFGGNQDGFVTSVIYTDNGSGIPVTELYAQQFHLDAPSSGLPAWDGAFGLDWTLEAGTYWLAFEERPGDFGVFSMPNSAPEPLILYSLRNRFGNWNSNPSFDLGMRISAIPSAVPIPAALWLFGSGLIGLITFARRR